MHTANLILLLICSFIVATFTTATLIARRKEKEDYNNGICPHCGTKLKNFDMASDGSRGYTCDQCNYTTWCSYNVDE